MAPPGRQLRSASPRSEAHDRLPGGSTLQVGQQVSPRRGRATWRRLASRRVLLAAALASPLLAGCATVEMLAQAAANRARPPAPELPIVRIAYPRLDYYYPLKTRLQTAARDVPPERAFIPDIQGISLAISTGENDTLDIPPPMAAMPRVYAQRAASSTFRADLLIADPVTIGALGNAGVLQDLGPLLARESWHQSTDFLGGALSAGTHNGRLLALPLEVAVEMLWRNRPAWTARGIEMPPVRWSWEQLLDAARRLTGAEGSRAWGCQITATMPSFWAVSWQQGADIVSSDGTRLSLTEPGTIRAVAFLADLVTRHRVAPPLDGSLLNDEVHLLTRAYGLDTGRFGRSFPYGVATMGGLVGGPAWGRPIDGQLAAIPTDGAAAYLGVALLMLGIPRNAPDLRHSLSALRSYLEAGGQTLLTPTRRALANLRTDAMGLDGPEVEALRATVTGARYLPGQLPLDVVPTIQREFLLPALQGRRPPDLAARDARVSVEARLRQ